MRRSAIRMTVVVAVATLMSFAPQLRADTGCENVEGGAQLTFVGRWVGEVWIDIGGRSFDGDVVFETQSIRTTDDGNFNGTEEGVFDLGDGHTFTLLDKFVFGPSDEDPEAFHYRAVGRLTDGTGAFGEAYGRLVMLGFATFDPPPPVADITLKGRICNVQP